MKYSAIVLALALALGSTAAFAPASKPSQSSSGWSRACEMKSANFDLYAPVDGAPGGRGGQNPQGPNLGYGGAYSGDTSTFSGTRDGNYGGTRDGNYPASEMSPPSGSYDMNYGGPSSTMTSSSGPRDGNYDGTFSAPTSSSLSAPSGSRDGNYGNARAVTVTNDGNYVGTFSPPSSSLSPPSVSSRDGNVGGDGGLGGTFSRPTPTRLATMSEAASAIEREIVAEKAKPKKDYTRLKELKAKLNAQAALDEKRVKLEAELEAAEWREDYDKCEELQEQLDRLDLQLSAASGTTRRSRAPLARRSNGYDSRDRDRDGTYNEYNRFNGDRGNSVLRRMRRNNAGGRVPNGGIQPVQGHNEYGSNVYNADNGPNGVQRRTQGSNAYGYGYDAYNNNNNNNNNNNGDRAWYNEQSRFNGDRGNGGQRRAPGYNAGTSPRGMMHGPYNGVNPDSDFNTYDPELHGRDRRVRRPDRGYGRNMYNGPNAYGPNGPNEFNMYGPYDMGYNGVPRRMRGYNGGYNGAYGPNMYNGPNAYGPSEMYGPYDAGYNNPRRRMRGYGPNAYGRPNPFDGYEGLNSLNSLNSIVEFPNGITGAGYNSGIGKSWSGGRSWGSTGTVR